MINNYNEITSRNIGIFTEEEQEKLKNSTVSIAGMGGVGGLLAERLIRIGIGHIKITDMGAFDKSNFNRQFCSGISTLEKNKAEVIYNELKDINNEAIVEFSNSGINSEDDANNLVSGSDLVIDEMDYGAWKESICLQRSARRNNIYYIFAGALGFGALLSNFAPDGITLEEYNNLPVDIDLDDIDETSVKIERILPVVPSYIFNAMTPVILQEIIAGRAPIPTCSIGVGLASILAANEAVNILLNRKKIVSAPQYIYIDLMDKILINDNI